MARNGGESRKTRWKLLVILGIPGALLLGLIFLVLHLGVMGTGGGSGEGSTVRVEVPSGATFGEVAAILEEAEVVKDAGAFTLFARLLGKDRGVRAGPYALRPGMPWTEIMRHLTEGRVLTETLTIPEGFRLTRMAPRIGEITGLPPDSVLSRITGDSVAERWSVPGPGLEGYLFPDTYRFAPGAPLDVVIRSMVEEYEAFWTPEREARRDSLGLSEREAVTLASIIQAEARLQEEMPLISAVYHNRLDRGQLLQADPTVLYALGGSRSRLLYAAMDSVADHPYNTYTHPGLPPGPIGAPGEAALEAALDPADSDARYFVARPDGSHIFSRTLAEHNRAVARMRKEWDRFRREQAASQDTTVPGGGP
jgi:UPF0755 protein